MNVIVDDIETVVIAMRPTGADAAAIQASTISKFGQDFYDYIDSIGQVDNLTSIPYYIYGTRMEIMKRLTEMDKDEVRMFKKYPLIALGMDIPERVVDGVLEFNLNIAFLNLTDKNYPVKDRYTNIFKPILYPMYKQFKEQFSNVGLFMWSGDQESPPHQKFDRPYWGTQGISGNTANILNDPLDAIELVNFTFRQEIKC
jgi:hypothetical protein